MKVLGVSPMLLVILAVCSCSPSTTEQSGTEAQNPPVAPPPSTEVAPIPPPPAPQPAAPRPAAPKPANSPAPRVNNNSDVPSRPAEPSSAAYKAPSTPAVKKPQVVVVPAGTELHVVLAESLNSSKSKVGDRFTATLAGPVYVDASTVLERGATLHGSVLAADGSGRVSGKATMKLALDGLARSGDTVPIATKELAFEAESSTGRDAKVIGGGAGIGAIIGAIAGGAKGAATGAAIGGAAGTGTVLATKGKEVDLPVESKLTFTLEKDLTVVLE